MLWHDIQSRSTARRRGFTLIEAAMATMIVGLGVVSIMQLFATSTINNRASAQVSTATMLTTNIQEAMGGLSFADPGTAHMIFGPENGEVLATYDDVDDFDQASLSPPINSQRQQLANLNQYTQVVSVWPVYTTKLSVNSNETSPDVPKTTYTGAVRVRVRILYRATPDAVAEEVYRASWIRMDG